MDENSNNKKSYQVIDMSEKETKKVTSHSFSKTILLPFCSGILGATLVIGTCFGIPGIRNMILPTTELIETSTSSRKCGNT